MYSKVDQGIGVRFAIPSPFLQGQPPDEWEAGRNSSQRLDHHRRAIAAFMRQFLLPGLCPHLVAVPGSPVALRGYNIGGERCGPSRGANISPPIVSCFP